MGQPAGKQVQGVEDEQEADIRSKQGSRQVVIADVTLADKKNLYTSLGNDWLDYLSLAGFVFFIVFQSVVKAGKKGRSNNSQE